METRRTGGVSGWGRDFSGVVWGMGRRRFGESARLFLVVMMGDGGSIGMVGDEGRERKGC